MDHPENFGQPMDSFVIADDKISNDEGMRQMQSMLAEPHILVSFSIPDLPEGMEESGFGTLGFRFLAGHGPTSNEEILMLLEAACVTLRQAGVNDFAPQPGMHGPDCSC